MSAPSDPGRKSSSNAGSRPSFRGTQHSLAMLVVGLSILGTTLAAAFAIIYASSATERSDMTRLVFTSVLPLFGTWVGTVLAFYFAGQNLQTATDSTLRLAGRLDPGTPVDEVMIPKAQIQSYDLKAGDDVNQLQLGTIYNLMTTSKRNRIPILDGSAVVRYVIHQSTINSLASSSNLDPASTAFTKTMADLLADADLKAAVTAIGFVGPDAVIAEARAAMRSINHCNDVFVTRGGRNTDPVIGWLTNTDLAGTP
jgi:predicted outer membrane lipoprotein